MTTWKLEDAKNSFSKVVRMAESDGAQFITRHGEVVAVVVSAKEHSKGRLRGPEFVKMLRQSPLTAALRDAGLDELPLPSRSDYPRTVDFDDE